MTKLTRTDLLQGTLDMMILKTLAPGEMHGWNISKKIQEASKNTFEIKQGSLYPALHRLESKGFIRSEWGASENNRKAKFYTLTSLGKGQLEDEEEIWQLFAQAVNLVMQIF
jgi:transcriptional regulator